MERPVLFKKDSSNWIFIPLSPGADILMTTLKNRELHVVFEDQRFNLQDEERSWKRNLKEAKRGAKVIHSRLPRGAIGIVMKVKTYSFACKNCKKEKVAASG